jgi:DNA-binding MarR family transcriptional regulator
VHLCQHGAVTTADEPDYPALLVFRTALRRFNRWSEQQAEAAGLTHAQHQLLLAIKGHGDPRGPTIGDVADYLLLRHHSAVELVNRAEAAGLVQRCADPDRYRVVRLTLTRKGADTLQRLAAQHLDELAHLAPAMEALWRVLEQAGGAGEPHPAARTIPATGHEGEDRPSALDRAS